MICTLVVVWGLMVMFAVTLCACGKDDEDTDGRA